MNKKYILLFIILGITLGVSSSQIYNNYKNSNILSKCYTNLQPSKFFKDNPSPYMIDETGIKIYIDNEFYVSRGTNTGSMRPIGGDGTYFIIVNVSKEEIKIGDIISINRENDLNLLHRIIKITKEGYITRGDNNDVEDSEIWKFEQINGKVVGILY